MKLNQFYYFKTERPCNGTPVDDIHAVIDVGPGVEIGSIDENPSSRSGVSVDCTVSGSTITCDATGNNIPTTGVFDIAEITLQAVAIGPVDVKFVEPKTVTTAKSSGNPVLQKAVDAMVRVNGLVAVNMTVDLQKPAPGDIEGFEVRFYGEDALKPTSMNKPWRIFDSQPLFAADLVAGSDSTGGTSFTFMPAGDRTFMAKLDADQEVHDVTGVDAMGTGIFVLNPDQTELSYHITVDTTLLSTQSISAAHFHNAAVGVDGDVVRTLSFDGGTSSGVWKSTDSQSFDSDMVDALLAGELYINVHTSTNSAGEIRGQVLALASGFSAMLDSDQAVPTPSGNPQAMGVGALTLNSAETELEYHITIDTGSLTSDLRFAHFHNARAGATGGVVRTLTFVGGTASGTWRSTDDQPLSPALVKELLGGNIYANVHTDDNLPGEIRGQVLAVRTPIRTGVYHVVVVTNRDGDGLKNTLASLAPGVIIEETDLTIDMSILREGNAVDDPSSERSAIINALDASVLAAAISEDEFDARVDFDRDGDVDDDDLELLKDNYLLYSPVIVEQQ